MPELAEIFATNRIIVLTVYGEVFFVLGLAVALQSLKRSTLPWRGRCPGWRLRHRPRVPRVGLCSSRCSRPTCPCRRPSCCWWSAPDEGGLVRPAPAVRGGAAGGGDALPILGRLRLLRRPPCWRGAAPRWRSRRRCALPAGRRAVLRTGHRRGAEPRSAPCSRSATRWPAGCWRPRVGARGVGPAASARAVAPVARPPVVTGPRVAASPSASTRWSAVWSRSRPRSRRRRS